MLELILFNAVFLILLVTFYYASLRYVRPLLEYNFSVWFPSSSTDISILESVEKDFNKRLLGMESLTYNKSLVALKLPSLFCRRNWSDLILLYRIIQYLIDIDLSKLYILPSLRCFSIYHYYKWSIS